MNARLEVHHITKITDAGGQARAYDDDNLITLCPLCHKLADAGEISEKKLRDIARRNNENSNF